LPSFLNARSVALDLFPSLTDTVPFRHPLLPASRPSPDATQFPSLLISYVATLLLSPSLIQLVAPTSGSVCSQLLTLCSPLADYSTLKMEVIRSSETSVNPSSTQRHIPEDNILHNFLMFVCVSEQPLPPSSGHQTTRLDISENNSDPYNLQELSLPVSSSCLFMGLLIGPSPRDFTLLLR
jgi:hypothetical protein